MADAGAETPLYRCYFLDHRGRVLAAEVIEHPDDASATAAALGRLADHNSSRLRYTGLELWDRDRRVYPTAAARPGCN